MIPASARNATLTVGILAVVLGILTQAVSGNYPSLILAGVVMFALAVIVKSAFGLCLAIGMTCPFLVKLPFVAGLPVYSLALLICGAGVALRAGTAGNKAAAPHRSFDVWIALFYGYLLIRYAAKPALPGVALGVSMDISGFRSWFDHLMCAASVFGLGLMIRTRQDVKNFLFALLLMSVVFALVLLAAMPVPSPGLTRWLADSGIMVAFHANGWRRFVMLPTMGLVMIAAALLPGAFKLNRRWKIPLMGIGIVAVLAGGNRTSFISLLLLVATILVLKRRYIAILALVLMVMTAALAINVMCRTGTISSSGPFVRVFGLFNREISETTGGVGNIEWRLVRWKRAIEDIKQRPFWGHGYGGMQGYLGSLSEFHEVSEEFTIERDMATGSSHNGYLSAARAFGIPAAVLCAFILLRQCVRHFRMARRLRDVDPALFEWHTLVHGFLLIWLQILLISGEIRQPDLWLYVGLGFILMRLENPPGATAESRAARPKCSA